MSADQPPPGRPAPDEPAVSRRALGGWVAVVSTALLTAGCDSGEGLDLPGLPTVGEEPDQDRVVTGLRDEQAVLDQVVRVRQRHRTLRRALAATEAVHTSHVALLGRAVDADEEPGGAAGGSRRPRVPGDPAQAVAQLVALERSLAGRHVATAMRSRSGTLARVMAAMSAAAAQQAVVLAPLAIDLPEQEG